MKVHLAFSVPNAFGGFTSGHACGREHSDNDCENNVTTEHDTVTCKLCRNIIDDTKHWRHRKYISSQGSQV